MKSFNKVQGTLTRKNVLSAFQKVVMVNTKNQMTKKKTLQSTKKTSSTCSKGGRSRKRIQSISNHFGRLCCKVCLKTFPSNYYLDEHRRKKRCKNAKPSLQKSIEYVIVNDEVHNDHWESTTMSPGMSPCTNSNNSFIILFLLHIWVFKHIHTSILTYIRTSQHIYV